MEAALASRHSSAASVAEIVLGLVLFILALMAAGLAYKYHAIRKEKENYRIFNNEVRFGHILKTCYPFFLYNAILTESTKKCRK